MRTLFTVLAAMACIQQVGAAPATDPSTGPWWKAPEISFTVQTEDADDGKPDGFLAPIVTLKRMDDGTYSVETDSRLVLPGETRELPRCTVSGKVAATGAGRFAGTLAGRGGITIADAGAGVAEIRFERPGDCFRTGRYLGNWTAPH